MSTNKETIDAYNSNAEDYHAHVSNSAEAVYHSYYEKPAIRSLVPDPTGLSVLSIGCGSGLDARYLKDMGAKEVVGIDISKKLIEIAKRENKDIDFQVMDMEQLEFVDGSFDICYSSLAIHYLQTWTDALKEAYRVLKNNGVYVFSAGHPIDSSMEQFETNDSHGARLGKTIMNENNSTTIHGDYLGKKDSGVVTINGGLGKMNVRTYQRTFSKMIEEVIASGFRIEQVTEPQPQEDLRDIDNDTYNYLKKIPNVIIWSLRKE